jgi:hypothetical protein
MRQKFVTISRRILKAEALFLTEHQAVVSQLSRRALLTSASTVLLSVAAKPNSGFAAAEKVSNGRINLGLSGIAYYMLLYPFLNVWKCGGAIQVVASGVNHFSNIAPGTANSAWDRYLDSDGELVNPLRENVTQLLRVFYAQPRDGVPEGYNRVGDRWVLKWDGTASKVTIAGAASQSQSSKRVDWTWGSNTANMWVTFSGMSTKDPPRNIRLCEKRFEDRLDVGEIFNPEWLAKVHEGSGIIRAMDWGATNFNVSTLRFSDIPDKKYFSYGGSAAQPFIKGGMPLSIISNLANRVQSHPWVCIPIVLGTKKLSSVATISNANPALVTSPGHTWIDGDQVIPYITNWPQIEKNRYTVVNSDRKAGTFALSGVDSTSFGPYTSRLASVTAPYDLGSIANELAPLAAHFRDNIAAGLVTYFELGNETWNFIFNAPHWLAAQSRGKISRDDNSWMSGYLSAHCMMVIRDTYTIGGRDKWRGVLATQTTNPSVTNRMIAGVKQYIEEHDRSLKIADLFDDIAVTGYFGGNLVAAQKTTVMNWMDLSEERANARLEPTKYSYFNRVVNEDLADGRYSHIPNSLDNIVKFWHAHKEAADANGLGLIQYEGGNNNVPIFLGNLGPAEWPRVIDFYKHSCHTTEDANNYKSMFNSFAAIGGKYPAKFVEAGAVTRFGNWGALRYPGDGNPVWDAVVAFNARF